MNFEFRGAADRRIELERHRGQAPGLRIGARVLHLRRIRRADLRAARLDGHHAGDQLGAQISNVKSHSAAL